MNEKDQKFHDSYFNMWRALVSLSHIDNDVSDEEKMKIKGFIKNLKFESEKKSTLENDLVTKSSPDDFIELITVPAHISQLHHFANIIFKVDGLHKKEKAYFEKIESSIYKKINMLGALKMVEEEQRLDSLKEIKTNEGFFGALIDYFNDN